MKLLNISLHAVRGVPDGEYAFVAPVGGAPLDVVLITGAPSSGKTSLLEAIATVKEAAGGYGPPPKAPRMLRAGATSGRIEATWILSPSERARGGIAEGICTTTWKFSKGESRAEVSPRFEDMLANYSRDPEHGKFEYFAANRSLLGGPSRAPAGASPAAHEGRLRLTKDPGKYAGLRRVLCDLALADAGRVARLVAVRGLATRGSHEDGLAPYKDVIAAVLPDLRLAGVELRDDGSSVVRFVRRDRAVVELEDLSESEQQGVLFALAFHRFGLNHSIVLIDGPELHQSPTQHVRFLQSLVALGNDNQIIAATSSTEILSAAAAGQVINLSRAAREPSLTRAAG